MAVLLEWGHDEAVADIITSLAGAKDVEFGNSRALAVIDGDRLIGGIIVHGWNPEAGTAEISGGFSQVKVPYRRVARVIANYVFYGMNCQAVYLRTDARSKHVIDLCQSMGATVHILPRMRGRAASEATLIITDDAWKASKWSKRNEVAKGTNTP